MIHIRCKACHQYLAGPLDPKPQDRRPDIGLTEYVEIGNVDFAISPVLDFTPESDSDLLIHAQWYESWLNEWPDRCDGAQTRMMFIAPKGNYGCCGPTGDAKCECGVKLGRVWADCIGPHCIFLLDKLIERSDQTDGYWTLLTDADKPTDWIESVGELQGGQQHGDWECWYNAVAHAAVEKRDKNRNVVQETQCSVTRSQFRLESWGNGTLISAADSAK